MGQNESSAKRKTHSSERLQKEIGEQKPMANELRWEIGSRAQAREERILGNSKRLKRDQGDTLGEMLKEDTKEEAVRDCRRGK